MDVAVSLSLFIGTLAFIIAAHYSVLHRITKRRVDDVYDDLFRAQLELQRISLKIDDLKLEIKKD